MSRFKGAGRVIVLLLLLPILVFVLSACGGGDDKKEDSGDNDHESQNTENSGDTVNTANEVNTSDATLKGIELVSEGTLDATDPIPVPASEDDIILTISGLIDPERVNADGKIVMDLAAIEAVGLYRYEMNPGDDPFTEDSIVYEGVLLRDLIELWGVQPEAKTIKITALDRYQVEVPISEFLEMPVMLALKENGEYMSIERHGPAMFVYPMSHYTLDENIYGAYFAYMVVELDVR